MRWRSFAWLAASILVVSALAAIAVWAQEDAARSARSVHRADRVDEQKMLSGLTGQYLGFTFLATNTAAQSSGWSLRPGDPADVARLRAFVTSSQLTTYGAALVSLVGTPLTTYPSAAGALPPAIDPGYGALRAGLLAGRPGLSSVMSAHGRPVVAFGVPVMRSGHPAAVLLAYADLRTWPLEGYVQKLDLGAGALSYTVDANGVVVAAKDPALIGHPLADRPALTALSAQRVGSATFRRGTTPITVSYGPAGVGGWGAVTEQPSGMFLGNLPARNDRVVYALVAMLTMVVILLVVLHHRRQRLAQQLAEQRLYDPLTGLGTRAIFDLKLAAAIARQERTRTPVAVVYCDLDRFKEVNDRFGHNAGDQLLVAVSARLRSAARAEDAVVRLGGDEFAIVVEGVPDAGSVEALVARVREVSGPDVVVGNERIAPRLSVGAAVLMPGGPADELVHAADLAMYEAKTTGAGHSVTVLRPTVHAGGTVRVPRQSGVPADVDATG